ncbi:thiamine pyrophosphate-binding protein [Pseudomonas sp. SLFW]|uniref:thiamine pyrophosphate-binding protein n=1 Tax=Pseudomonas sp. SLFW TaxID=2683259 RepID=UPI001412850A|nr:thiamine pyrophosphate-binding protein [Pseudomonas sp. SLFW]NBB09873.1 thiamine pyrophosphate-binding protein [Pseudomonas sp. SLFW]
MTHSVPSNAPGRPTSTLRQAWRTYRVHLNVLLILIPVAFIPTYFSDFANRVDGGPDGYTLGEIDTGPCSLLLTEHASGGQVRRFTAALSERCRNDVKATYLHVGKSSDPRTLTDIFSGTPNRMSATVTLTSPRKVGEELWVTMLGWDGSVHQARAHMDQASGDRMASSSIRRDGATSLE